LFILPFLLTCCPLILSGFALRGAYRQYRATQIRRYVLWILAVVAVIPLYAVSTYIWFTLRPTSYRAPWNDPATLNLAILVLLAPIGFLLTMFAGFRGAATRVLLPLIAAMLLLFVVGFLVADSV